MIVVEAKPSRVARHKQRLLASGGRRMSVSLTAEDVANLRELRALSAARDDTDAVRKAIAYAAWALRR